MNKNKNEIKILKERFDDEYELTVWWLIGIISGIIIMIVSLYYDPLRPIHILDFPSSFLGIKGFLVHPFHFYAMIGKFGLFIIGFCIAFVKDGRKLIRYWIISGMLIIISYFSDSNVRGHQEMLIVFYFFSTFYVIFYIRDRYHYTTNVLKKIQILLGLNSFEEVIEIYKIKKKLVALLMLENIL